MSDARATFDELEVILARLPGVSVESTDAWPGHLSIVMRIERMESVGPIVYCTDGANVGFDIWSTAPREPFQERANPAHLRYRITAKDSDSGCGTALRNLKFFGVYLVWYLHGIGVLETNEANRLLTDWDGKLVAA